MPHVLITGDPAPLTPDNTDPFTGGQSEITGCRFGRETPPDTDGPPEVAIEVRPVKAQSVLGLLISRNQFNGRNGGPTDTSAVHAIAVQGRLRNSVVSSNYFELYQGALISEEEPAGPRAAPSNFFVANAVTVPAEQVGDPIQVARIHGAKGQGWVIDNPLDT